MSPEKKTELSQLARKIRNMTPEEKSAAIAQYGIRTAEGRMLSAFNCIFLAYQTRPVPVQVGGFRQWRKVNRTVRAGEHACGSIFVPLVNRKESEEGEESVHFRLVPVFSIDQTEPLS